MSQAGVAPADALTRLREGNARFVSGEPTTNALTVATQRAELVSGQQPFAVVLGCSDSRVPVELVFDQGVGDLFVIRVAGNVVAPSQVGSVEFAVEQFGTRLVVVLGHTACGAVRATIDQLRQPSDLRSPNLASIVDRVRPAVESLLQTDLRDDPGELERQAVRANVRVAADHLRHGSRILEQRVEAGDVVIVGAEYALDTGRVEFL